MCSACVHETTVRRVFWTVSCGADPINGNTPNMFPPPAASVKHSDGLLDPFFTFQPYIHTYNIYLHGISRFGTQIPSRRSRAGPPLPMKTAPFRSSAPRRGRGPGTWWGIPSARWSGTIERRRAMTAGGDGVHHKKKYINGTGFFSCAIYLALYAP